MSYLRQFLAEHPDLQKALEHSEDIAAIAQEAQEICTQAQQAMQPHQFYQSAETTLLPSLAIKNMYKKSEAQAQEALDAFEQKHPEIVALAKLLDEYNHLKAELHMTQLGEGAHNVYC